MTVPLLLRAGRHACSSAHVVRGHLTELHSQAAFAQVPETQGGARLHLPASVSQLSHRAYPQSFCSAFLMGTIAEIKEPHLIRQGSSFRKKIRGLQRWLGG